MNMEMMGYKNNQLEKVLTSIIKWGVYIALLTPLIVVQDIYFSFIVPKTIFFRTVIEIVFAFYLILALFFPKYRPRINVLSVSVFLFILISIISSLFGVDIARSFWGTYERMTGLFTILHLYGLFLILSNVFKEKEDWDRLFMFSVGVGLFSSATFDSYQYPGQEGAGIGNSSFWASYLLFDIFFAVYLFLKHKFSFYGLFSFFSFLVMANTILSSSARAAIICFWLGLFLIVVSLMVLSEKKVIKFLGFLIVFIVIVLVLSYFFFVDEIKEVANSFLEKDNSMQARFFVWDIGWRGFLERPILGWGLENFNIVYSNFFKLRPQLGSWRDYSVWFDRSHNTPLDVLIHSGVLGLISYLSLFLVSIFYLFKKRDNNPEIVFIVLLTIYFIQNLTVFDVVSSYMAFFLVLAFVNSLTKENEEIIKSKFFNDSFKRKAALSLIFISTIVLIFFGNIQPFLSAKNIANVLISEDLSEEFESYKESLNTLKYNNEINREAIDHILKNELDVIEDEKVLKDFLILINEKAKEDVKNNPLNLRAKITLSKTYSALRKVTEDVKYSELNEEVLKEALKINSKKEQIYGGLIFCYANQAKYQEIIDIAKRMKEEGLEWRIRSDYFQQILYAYEAFERYEDLIPLYNDLLDIRPKDDEVWIKLSICLFNVGNLEDAKIAAQKAIKLNPGLEESLGQTLEILLQGD